MYRNNYGKSRMVALYLEYLMSYDYEIHMANACGINFAPLPELKCAAVPAALPWKKPVKKSCNQEQEGNKPMAYCNNTTTKTDAQIQRDYLKDRLMHVNYEIRDRLTQMFNLYVEQSPQNYKDLIDWITNGKYTLDAKMTAKIDAKIAAGDGYYGGPFAGINWNGSGKPTDYPGFEKAEAEMEKARTAAMDIIVTGDAAAGLAALQAFEAFVPSNAPAANDNTPPAVKAA